MIKYCSIVMLLVMTSCASVPENQRNKFNLSGRKGLYEKTKWSFLGRIAIIDKNNAVSANIVWEHESESDAIELAGLFGLGRTKIVLTERRVEVSAEGKVYVETGEVNDIISAKLGVKVPFESLKYWVLGVVDPAASYTQQDYGFDQHGWKIRYLQMQEYNKAELMPRKMKVERGSAKIKLIVNQWDI